MTKKMVTPEELMGLDEVVEFLGLSKRAVAKLRSDGRFPLPFSELTIGAVWLQRDINGWTDEERPERPTGAKMGQRAQDPLDHIVTPASLMDDLSSGKPVKAVCGKVITHKSRPGAPVCRKCFTDRFPNVK